MKLRCAFEMVNMENEIIGVPVGENAHLIRGVLKLNKEGQEIIELLKNDTTEALIEDTLIAKYDNNRSDLVDYVRKTLAVLRCNGLIEE